MTVTQWGEQGTAQGWPQPEAAHILLRLPLVRLVRWLWVYNLVLRHYGAGIFRRGEVLRTGYDEWVLRGILRGYC